MTHLVYSKIQLEAKSIKELKAIASQMSITPEGDKRKADVWVEAILGAQPQKISEEPLISVEVEQSDLSQITEIIIDGRVAATITFDETHLTQPWVVTVNGIEFCRNSTWSRCHSDICWHYKQGTLRVFPEVEQLVNLPVINESHFVGDFLLRCTDINTDGYAAIWEVCNDGVALGDIRMGWDCLWSHPLSLATFATPQEATIDLYESAQKIKPIPKTELEVFATRQLNTFAVYNRKSGQRYEVYPVSNACTCPHWAHRHHQSGFKDKHLEAVKVAIESGLPISLEPLSDTEQVIEEFIKEFRWIGQIKEARTWLEMRFGKEFEQAIFTGAARNKAQEQERQMDADIDRF